MGRTGNAFLGRHVPSVAVCLLALSATPATAQVHWTDWTGGVVGGGVGVMDVFGTAVGVTYTGPAAIQTNAGTYWDFPVYDVPNRPLSTDGFVQINLAGTHTLAFSAPVTDLFLGIISMGQPGSPITWVFDNAFTILTNGPGFWGNGPLTQVNAQTLEGEEGHGVIQFSGSFSTLSWTSSPNENWQGFNVGVSALDQSTVTPEPVTMTLLGTGLFGIGAAARRRRRNSASRQTL